MPDGIPLYGKDFVEVLETMYAQKKFHRMTIYIEACESGSLFEDILPPNMNIYVTTAANSNESSYACFFDPVRKTFLADTYSIQWISTLESYTNFSLQEQYVYIRDHTTKSHVMQYGMLNFTQESINNFMSFAIPTTLPHVLHKIEHNVPNIDPAHHVNARDVKLERLLRLYKHEKNQDKTNYFSQKN